MQKQGWASGYRDQSTYECLQELTFSNIDFSAATTEKKKQHAREVAGRYLGHMNRVFEIIPTDGKSLGIKSDSVVC